LPSQDSQHHKLRECYLTLGLTPQAQWLEIKQTYRKLVQKNHPDRFTEGTTAHQQAVNNFIALQQAYERLSTHHQNLATANVLPFQASRPSSSTIHGMPNDSINSARNNGARDNVQNINSARPYRSRTEPSASKRKRLLLAVILLCVGYIFLNKSEWIRFDQPIEWPQEKSALISSSVSAFESQTASHFGTGDTMQTVLQSQGQPSRIEENSWFYGESKIVFLEGKVVDWYSSTETPLHIR
jgi:hypothetical protein